MQSNAVIAIDTRQQNGRHVEKDVWFKEHNYKSVRTKLYVGDYTLLHNQGICIDTKKDINELSGNVCGKQHERFRNECIRAQEANIKLIILVEQLPPDNDLTSWTSKLTKVTGVTLAKCLTTITERYGVVFEFCSRAKSASRIVDILIYGDKDNGRNA